MAAEQCVGPMGSGAMCRTRTSSSASLTRAACRSICSRSSTARAALLPRVAASATLIASPCCCARVSRPLTSCRMALRARAIHVANAAFFSTRAKQRRTPSHARAHALDQSEQRVQGAATYGAEGGGKHKQSAERVATTTLDGSSTGLSPFVITSSDGGRLF